MEARFIAKTPPITAFPDQSIKDVAKIMSEKKIGLVVIVSKEDRGKILGVVSERDIVRAVAQNIDVEEEVMKIATKDVITVSFDDPIGHTAKKMIDHRIRHIVVVDEEGKLFGVISIRDIINEVHALQSLVSAEVWEWDEGMTS